MKRSLTVRLGLLGFAILIGMVILWVAVRSLYYDRPEVAIVSVAAGPSNASSQLGVATQAAVTPSPSKSAKVKPVNVQVVLEEHMALLNARWKVAVGIEGGIGLLEVMPQAQCSTSRTLTEGWSLCPANDQNNVRLMYDTKRGSELRSILASSSGVHYVIATMALFYAEYVVHAKLSNQEFTIFRGDKNVASDSIACWAGMSLKWFMLPLPSPDTTFQQWQQYLGQHNPAWKTVGSGLAKGYELKDWRDCLV